MNDNQSLGSEEMLMARQAAKHSNALGMVLAVLGVFAVVAPMFAGIAVTGLIGFLLVVAGIVEMVFAFKAGAFGKGVARFLFGGLGVLAGVIVFATPVASLGALTVVLVLFFLAGGAVEIAQGLKGRSDAERGGMLFSGIMSIALGLLIAVQWPVSGIWAVGIYVGFRMLAHGWLLMALGRSGQETLTHLQDTRIEMLEGHVRNGAQALQETQAALADHTAMLVALDNELRKKISSEEVDPGLVDLNQKLGEARKQMQEAAAATRESWNQTQKEASAAFEELQKSAEEMSKGLKDSLGLSQQGKTPGDSAE